MEVTAQVDGSGAGVGGLTAPYLQVAGTPHSQLREHCHGGAEQRVWPAKSQVLQNSRWNPSDRMYALLLATLQPGVPKPLEQKTVPLMPGPAVHMGRLCKASMAKLHGHCLVSPREREARGERRGGSAKG